MAVSQDGAGAFLNAIPMRDDMRMETWAMRLSVQRRLGLPLDVACQAAAAGKKTRNGKTHDELGDAAVNVPQQGHNTRHKYTLRRLILALRAAWGTAVRMEPKGHLGQSYNKQPDVDASLAGAARVGEQSTYPPLPPAGEKGLDSNQWDRPYRRGSTPRKPGVVKGWPCGGSLRPSEVVHPTARILLNKLLL